MAAQTSQIADCISRYANRLHAVIGTRHHVASPLGAWLLLALAGPASTGADRVTMTDVLGCDVEVASRAAADLLASPHPLVASATAVWTATGAELAAGFYHWRDGLPAEVTRGDIPDQAGLDGWAREHTFGLIDRFPVRWSPSLYLVLASALATKVSWEVPFDLAPAASLGAASPWAGQVGQVLRTPAHDRRGHTQFVAVTDQAGDVIVQMATATGGLIVISVAALPEVPAAQVLAAAHRIGCLQTAGAGLPQRALADLPLGEGPLWLVREENAQADTCTAVLPAWSAASDFGLDDPVLGFAAARDALAPGPDPWEAKQSAMARYSRTGFEAAAVSALMVASSLRLPSPRRVVELRFAHPYAVVAFTTDPNGTGRSDGVGQSPWHGLPVFSAWVSSPEDATDEPEPAPGIPPESHQR